MSETSNAGKYQYASVVRTTEYDPRNDIEEGQIRLVAGKHEDGWSYTVLDEENEGFLDIECETLGVVGPSDYPMGEKEITAWAADGDEARKIAEGSR